MSKYVIEFDKEQLLEYDKDTDTYFRTLYKAKGFDALVFDKYGLDKLTPLDKALEEAYQKGYEVGQHEATTLEYQQGLDDVWETINKIASIPYAKRSEIFDGQQDILSIVQKFSPSEAIDKLREYEQQKLEIKVGDEVEAFCGRAIVFGTSTDKKGNKFCQYWYPSADRFDKDKIANLKKTGRYFPQVAELLKVIKSEQRDCHTCKHPDSIECVDCRRFGRWQPKEGVE